MPCIECEDGKFKWGENGDCIYDSQEECEEANGDAEAHTSRIIRAISSSPWAITEAALDQIVIIARRLHEKPESLTTRPRSPLPGARMASIRDGVGVLSVVGPIFRYANLFAEISGATSIQRLGMEFQSLMDNPEVHSIILEIDSPGGQVAGTSEFAETVANARGVKPVIAYVSDVAASGAYWIASGAEKIVTRDTGVVGSIGVVATIRLDKDENRLQVVSSQSPKKRPDFRTEEGLAEVQGLVDSLASVFVKTVAKNRGVSVEEVLDRFGKGGLIVGAEAVRRGMADGLGSLEALITQLGGSSMSNKDNAPQADPSGLTVAVLKEARPDLVKAIEEQAVAGVNLVEIRSEAAKAERERIEGIEAIGIPGHEDLVQKLKFDGQTSPESAAHQILGAEKKVRDGYLKKVQEDSPPVVAAETGGELGTLHEVRPGSTGKKVKVEDDDVPLSERARAEWDADASIRSEFMEDFDAYLAYRQANEEGLVHMLRK